MSGSSLCEIRFVTEADPGAATLAVLLDRAAPDGALERLAPHLEGRVRATLAERDNDDPLDIALPAGLAASRLVLWPIGDLAALGEGGRRRLGGRLAARLRSRGATAADVVVDCAHGVERAPWIAASLKTCPMAAPIAPGMC